jgi:hypothetical protein
LGWLVCKIQNFAPTGLCNTKVGQLHSKARPASSKEQNAPAYGLFRWGLSFDLFN